MLVPIGRAYPRAGRNGTLVPPSVTAQITAAIKATPSKVRSTDSSHAVRVVVGWAFMRNPPEVRMKRQLSASVCDMFHIRRIVSHGKHRIHGSFMNTFIELCGVVHA